MASPKIQSSPYTPVYPVSDSGNLLVEVAGTSGLGESTPTVRTPSLLITSSSGTIAAGATSIAIANSGSTNGTLLGATFTSGISVSWEAPYGDTLAAVNYNATGTTYIITEVR